MHHRLSTLRSLLKDQRLEGALVAHTDIHRSEYAPACYQRLTWLTGFTGSAGFCVVGLSKAALFVDSRYTLQAAEEVDPSLFEILPLSTSAIQRWLKKTFSEKSPVGYDPWLLNNKEKTAYEMAGISLVPQKENPIDFLWKDRPSLPKTSLKSHNLNWSGVSTEDKVKLLLKRIQEKEAEAAFFTDPQSLMWLLNIRGNDIPCVPISLCFGVLWVTGKIDFFIDQEKISTKMRAYLGDFIRLHPYDSFEKEVEKSIDPHKKYLLDEGISPVALKELIEKKEGIPVFTQDLCTLPKALKNKTEIEGARRAHLRDGTALCQFLAWLERADSVTELDCVKMLRSFRDPLDHFQGDSFPTIAATGPHGAIIHYHPREKTNRVLKKGDLFLLDSGAQYLDGTTDVTRTVAIGSPNPRHQEHYTLVLKGHIALANAVFPQGVTGAHLDVLARQALWKKGLNYGHGTGHGVGSYLSVHEGPQRISLALPSPELSPGMILSNEPGYYEDGSHGIRIESLMVVLDGEYQSFETLTLAPFDKNLILKDLLTQEELSWINTYHQRVYEKISPLVPKDTEIWLKIATSPF